MNIKELLKSNLLLKMTSLNAVVITTRLGISLIIQRILAVYLGEVGIAKIGQLRNLLQIITSTSSLGIFNGVVKYSAEFKDDINQLKGVFNTAFVFVLIGSGLTSVILFFCSSWISVTLFGNADYTFILRVAALLVIVIGVNRMFHGIINGFSEYKKYAKIDFYSYLLAAFLLLICLYLGSLQGVLISIVFAPVIQFFVILFVFGSVLKNIFST